jgi:hypothetical protein
LGIPIAVIATDAFTDVPESNVFHSSITWMKDNEVTLGCNPPDNDEYCPSDTVTREQMAAFMRRLAQTFGNAGTQVNEITDVVDLSTTLTEVLSIDVTPKAEVNVTLNAHVLIGTGATQGGLYEIRRDSCTGTVVSSSNWAVLDSGGLVSLDTFSLTGFDVTDTTTTYVLCVNTNAATDAAAAQRGLTASWSPDA